jgi:hypothetical protein
MSRISTRTALSLLFEEELCREDLFSAIEYCKLKYFMYFSLLIYEVFLSVYAFEYISYRQNEMKYKAFMYTDDDDRCRVIQRDAATARVCLFVLNHFFFYLFFVFFPVLHINKQKRKEGEISEKKE